MLDHEFKILPSKQYALAISFIILTSIILVISLPIQLVIKGGVCVFLLAYGRYLLKDRHSMTALKWLDKGRWGILFNNHWVEASLLGDTTVTGVVSVLRFRTDHRMRPYSFVIFKDAMQPDQYRQLLVILKMGA